MNPVRSSHGAMSAERTTPFLGDGMAAAALPMSGPVLDSALPGDLLHVSVGLPDVPNELLNIPSELLDELLVEPAPASLAAKPNVVPQLFNDCGIDHAPVLPLVLGSDNQKFPVGLSDLSDDLQNAPLYFSNEYVVNPAPALDPICTGNISGVPCNILSLSDDQPQTLAQFIDGYFINQAPALSSFPPGNLRDLSVRPSGLPVCLSHPPVSISNLPDDLLSAPLDFLNECIVDSASVPHLVRTENLADLSGLLPDFSDYPSSVPPTVHNERGVELAVAPFQHQIGNVVGTRTTPGVLSAAPADLLAPESSFLEEHNILISNTGPSNEVYPMAIPIETAFRPAPIFTLSSHRAGKRPASPERSGPKPRKKKKKKEKVVMVKGPRTIVNKLKLSPQPHEPGYKPSRSSPSPRGKRRQTKRKVARVARAPLARLKFGRNSIVSELQPANSAVGGTIAFSVGREPPNTPSAIMDYVVQAGTTLSRAGGQCARTNPRSSSRSYSVNLSYGILPSRAVAALSLKGIPANQNSRGSITSEPLRDLSNSGMGLNPIGRHEVLGKPRVSEIPFPVKATNANSGLLPPVLIEQRAAVSNGRQRQADFSRTLRLPPGIPDASTPHIATRMMGAAPLDCADRLRTAWGPARVRVPRILRQGRAIGRGSRPRRGFRNTQNRTSHSQQTSLENPKKD